MPLFAARHKVHLDKTLHDFMCFFTFFPSKKIDKKVSFIPNFLCTFANGMMKDAAPVSTSYYKTKTAKQAK